MLDHPRTGCERGGGGVGSGEWCAFGFAARRSIGRCRPGVIDVWANLTSFWVRKKNGGWIDRFRPFWTVFGPFSDRFRAQKVRAARLSGSGDRKAPQREHSGGLCLAMGGPAPRTLNSSVATLNLSRMSFQGSVRPGTCASRCHSGSSRTCGCGRVQVSGLSGFGVCQGLGCVRVWGLLGFRVLD